MNQQFFDSVEEVLGIVKFCVGAAPVLFVKLCRLFLMVLRREPGFGSSEERVQEALIQRIRRVVQLYLLPAILHFVGNPFIVQELWKVLS